MRILRGKSFLVFAFFPLVSSFLLTSSAVSRVETNVEGDNIVIYNSAEAKAESTSAKTESSLSTAVNDEKVEVKIDQPGSVELKNVNGRVEIKTSPKITPTIAATNVPTQKIEISEKQQQEELISFSKIINNKTSSIYCFFTGLFRKVFSPFLRKT